MIKRFFLMIIVVIIIFGGIFGFKFYMGMKMGEMMKSMPIPPVVVTATQATEEEWATPLEAIGTLNAFQSIGVASEVLGTISKISFESGQRVSEGDVLIKLDDSVEQAELKSLIALSELSKIELKRGEELIKTKSISQSELDTLKAKKDDYMAKIQAQQALIQKKTIKSPFSGILGIKKVDLGQFLLPGAEIVSLQSIDNIYADFTLPQYNLGKVFQGQEINIITDAYPDEIFSGTVTTIETIVDEKIRSFKLRATLSNKDMKLKPGMFVEVNVVIPDKKTVIPVPNTSISYAPYGNSVFIIKEDGKDKEGKPMLKAVNKMVKTGEKRGDKVAITSGIAAGETVITAGHLKLKGGEKVVVDNKIQPDNNNQPKPPNS